jgi:hypothetical protein
MIQGIIDLLQLDNYYGISKRIDIAKGLYSIPKSINDGTKQIKRAWKSKR